MKRTIITTSTRTIPIRIRITEQEHNHLKELAKEENKPLATIAYALLIHALNDFIGT